MYLSFAHPQYLFFLMGIPLFLLIHFYSINNKKKIAVQFANFDSIARITGVDFFSKNLVMLILNLLIIILLSLSLSGLKLNTMSETSVFSFVIAIDSSQSMSADDLSPSRLDVSKSTAIDFIEASPFGTNFGIVTFSANTYIRKDLTNDKRDIIGAIDKIELDSFGGTNLYESIITSSNLLKNEEHKAIILLSDGQINLGYMNQTIEYANENDVIVHTIAIGTKEGGMTDYAISRIDEETLMEIAERTGGEYFGAADEKELSNSFKNILEFTQKKVSVDLDSYLLMIAIILFVLGFFLGNTRYFSLV